MLPTLVQPFQRLSINVKLAAILVAMLFILVTTTVLIGRTAISAVMFEFGTEALEEDIAILQGQFQRYEQDIMETSRVLAGTAGLPEAVNIAVNTGDIGRLRTLLLVPSGRLGLDLVSLHASDGTTLLRFGEAAELVAPEAEAKLKGLGTIGAESSGLLPLTISEGIESPVLLAATVAIRLATGENVGILTIGRRLTSTVLDDLDFARKDNHIALYYEGKLAVRDLSAPHEFETDPPEEEDIEEAEKGSTVIGEEFNVDDFVATAPIIVGGEVQAVWAIKIENEATLAIERGILNALGPFVAIIVLVTLAFAIWRVRSDVTRPINALTVASQRMAGGNLQERISVSSQDEVGQLGTAFNVMADRVSDLVMKLEGQVKEAQTARDAAQRADQVKSAFLASMSHELRTPLNAVINFTKFVMKGKYGPVTEQQQTALSEVVDSSKHLLNLINDVLDMSKIESGSLKLFVEDNIDLKPLIEAAVNTGKALAAGKPIAFEVNIDPTLPLMRLDKQRMTQVLLNIVSNASKFTQAGKVTIHAAVHGKDVQIAVSDTGPGIAPEDHALVFEPFKQTRSGLRDGGGTGLGMPITRSLVEAHGGKIWLKSEPGEGSTFAFSLPLKNEHLAPAIITQSGMLVL
jgi:signal transduction histidine kinase